MRFIAIISVFAIIAVTVIIVVLISRLKSRQSEELANKQGRLTVAEEQVRVARQALRTIRDLQGDSAFDAQMALDQIDKLRDEYYNQEALTK